MFNIYVNLDGNQYKVDWCLDLFSWFTL